MIPPSENPVLVARAVARALARGGVREVVVCAGARNAALVAALSAARGFRLWSFPEERSAGFFALGRSVAADRPVAVVTTSGTAVAELLPSMIEAHYQGVPLWAVTADRPRAYRGTGAPQAIEQPGIFGPYVARSFDVAGVAGIEAIGHQLTGHRARRPLHLNICLEEPNAAELTEGEWAMEEEAAGEAMGGGESDPVTTQATETLVTFLHQPGPLVALVAALPAAWREPVAALLHQLGCPVWAEATSGLREHPALAARLLRGGEASLAGLETSRVLRIGGVPSCRWWRDLEQRSDVAVCSVTDTGFSGLARASQVLIFSPQAAPTLPLSATSSETEALAARLAADRAQAARVEAALAAFPLSEPALVRALSQVIPAGSSVFLGNSLPIREWHAFAAWENRGLRCQANRGANGIDGLVSTWLGLSADEPESWGIVGDLSALYDLAAPWIAPALPPARRRLVVINNGGGRIFQRAVALRGASVATRRLMENPHALEFRPWAELWGWNYREVRTPQALSGLPDDSTPWLIEIKPDPAQSDALWAALA